MSILDDFAELVDEALVAVDSATGGVASIAVGLPPGTLGTVGAINIGAETAVGSGAAAGPVPTKGKPAAPAVIHPEACVQRYTMFNDFLLDTCTGKVWKYDQSEKSFAAVPRKLTHLEFMRSQIRAERVLDILKARHAENVLANLPGSMREEVNKKFQNDYVKVIEEAVNKMKPRS